MGIFLNFLDKYNEGNLEKCPLNSDEALGFIHLLSTVLFIFSLYPFHTNLRDTT